MIRSSLILCRAVLLALVAVLGGCAIHYGNAPDTQVQVQAFQTQTPVSFKVYDPSMASGGPRKIIETFRGHPYFANAQQIYDQSVPQQGVFVEVNTRYIPPSDMAMVFGYLSMASITLFPAFSTEDGFDISYRVFLDGKLKKTYKYDTRRYIGLWAGLLPFVWLNLLTTGEEEVFQAFTEQFLEASQELLTTL